MIGWFEALQPKPIQRSETDLEADRLFIAMKAQLQEELRQREQRERAERAAADADTPKGTSVAGYERVKHLLPECGDHFQRHALLTGGKATTY